MDYLLQIWFCGVLHGEFFVICGVDGHWPQSFFDISECSGALSAGIDCGVWSVPRTGCGITCLDWLVFGCFLTCLRLVSSACRRNPSYLFIWIILNKFSEVPYGHIFLLGTIDNWNFLFLVLWQKTLCILAFWASYCDCGHFNAIASQTRLCTASSGQHTSIGQEISYGHGSVFAALLRSILLHKWVSCLGLALWTFYFPFLDWTRNIWSGLDNYCGWVRWKCPPPGWLNSMFFSCTLAIRKWLVIRVPLNVYIILVNPSLFINPLAPDPILQYKICIGPPPI